MNFDGIIVVNKPTDWTSQDVCSKLKGRLHMKKIGHTGTLDPMATGVLPVCFGKATRIIEYFDRDIKSYHATMQLGIVTDTLDITGEVLERKPFKLIVSDEAGDIVNASSNSNKVEFESLQKDVLKSNLDEESGLGGELGAKGLQDCDFEGTELEITTDSIQNEFRKYTGEISQIPPKYSAVQINGRRAYDMARAGETVEIKPRNITIYSNEISNIDIDNGIIEFDVSCSKGTYIRTICDDIGRALGCGATMTSLVRTASGPFVLDNNLNSESESDLGSEKNVNSSLSSVDNTDSILNIDSESEMNFKSNLSSCDNSDSYTDTHSDYDSNLKFLSDESTEFKAYDLADIIAMEDDEIRSIVIPMDAPLCKLGTIEVDDNRVLAFCNGHPSGKRTYHVKADTMFDNFYKVYGKPISELDFLEECAALSDGDFSESAKCPPEFLGIGQLVDGNLIPYKVIAER